MTAIDFIATNKEAGKLFLEIDMLASSTHRMTPEEAKQVELIIERKQKELVELYKLHNHD